MTVMDEGLLEWLPEADDERGIRFLQAAGEWDFWSYRQVAERVREVGGGLREFGLRPGDVVTLIHQSGPDFVASFFGALLAGAVPSPLAPPMAFEDTAAYDHRILTLVLAAKARLVLCDGEFVERLEGLLTSPDADAGGGAGVEIRDAQGLSTRTPLGWGDWPAFATGQDPHTPALVQFTSGSSERPHAVRVSHGALSANIAAIRDWLELTPQDATASWLPLHHDMGLIGCLLTPVVNRSDLWLLRPGEFVRRPLRYLECFGQHGARLTAMPPFGLDYLTRRVPPEATTGLDLSEWRAVIVGAERIDPRVLTAFADQLEPRGFRRNALLPAYGLAEATLAVTGVRPTEEWTCLRPVPATLTPGRIVQRADDGLPMVGCGRPLRGVEVWIADESGLPVDSGTVGEIMVRGTGLADGYVMRVSSPSSFELDCLRTGDAGFLWDGELYVLGRLGDAMKIRGRTVFAEDLEAVVAAAGIPNQQIAVLLGERQGRPTALVLLEDARPGWAQVANGVMTVRAEGADVTALEVPCGTIQRTTSGKPRRRQLWQELVVGDSAHYRADTPIHAAVAAGQLDSNNE